MRIYQDTSLLDLPNEKWEPIDNELFRNRYLVSNYGRIKRPEQVIHTKVGKSQRKTTTRHLSSKILKQTKKSNGYLIVQLHYGGHNKVKHEYVHRLVGVTFLNNPHHYLEINHIDEVKTDNRLANLEWCTRKYNDGYGHHSLNIAKSLSDWVTISNLVITKQFRTSRLAAEWLKKYCKTSSTVNSLMTCINKAETGKTYNHLTHGFYCLRGKYDISVHKD